MAAPFSNTQLRVPPGFQNVLEALSREVLRHQPENIYDFATKYFADLLKRRAETGDADIVLLGAHLEDRYYNNKAFSQTNVNAHDPHQQGAAVKIQSEYRRHAAQKEMHSRREEQAVTTIQASFRGYQDRLRVMEMKKEMESARSAHHAQAEGGHEVREESDTEDDEKRKNVEMDEAATKIQAAFKGYVTRRDQAETHTKNTMERSEEQGTPPVRPQSGRHSERSFGNRDEEDEDGRRLEMEKDAEREKSPVDEDEVAQEYRGADLEEAQVSEDEQQQSEKDEAEAEHSAGEGSAPASSRHSKPTSPREAELATEELGNEAPAEEPAEEEEAPADAAHLRHMHAEADDNANNSARGIDDMEDDTAAGGQDTFQEEQPEDASEMQDTSRTVEDSYREKTPSPAPAEEGEEDATEQDTSARPAEEEEEDAGEQAEEINEEEAAE